MNHPLLRHDITASYRHNWYFPEESSPPPTRSTDRFFKWVYLLLTAFVIAGGVHNGVKSKWRFVDWLGEVWNPAACSTASTSIAYLPPYSDYQLLSYWALGTVVASFFVGTVLIYVFKVHAFGVTLAAITAQVLAPLCSGVYLYVSVAQHEKSQRALASILITAGVMLALLHCCARRKLIVVAKLFQVAAYGLDYNGGLIWWILCLWCAWVVVLLSCMAFTGFTLASGTLIPNSLVAFRKKDACMMAVGTRTYCCTYELEDYQVPYLVALWVFFFWTSTIIFQLRLFVISGVISQWYFSHNRYEQHNISVCRHIRHALGPQFGTSALGGLILWFVQLIRWMLKPIPLHPRNTICRLVFCPCSLVARCVLGTIECVSTFATILAAMMNTNFLDGGAQAVDLLRRNLLKTVYVWWLPHFVMNAAMFTLGVGWGVLVYYLTSLLRLTASQDQSAALALICCLISVVVLFLVGSVLLNITDVVYICYALDRERFVQTRQDVHILFHELPVHTTTMFDTFDPGYHPPAYVAPQLQQQQQHAAWSSYGYPAAAMHAPPPQQAQYWGHRLPPTAEHFAPPPLFQQWS